MGEFEIKILLNFFFVFAISREITEAKLKTLNLMNKFYSLTFFAKFITSINECFHIDDLFFC